MVGLLRYFHTTMGALVWLPYTWKDRRGLRKDGRQLRKCLAEGVICEFGWCDCSAMWCFKLLYSLIFNPSNSSECQMMSAAKVTWLIRLQTWVYCLKHKLGPAIGFWERCWLTLGHWGIQSGGPHSLELGKIFPLFLKYVEYCAVFRYACVYIHANKKTALFRLECCQSNVI